MNQESRYECVCLCCDTRFARWEIEISWSWSEESACVSSASRTTRLMKLSLCLFFFFFLVFWRTLKVSVSLLWLSVVVRKLNSMW